MRTIHLKIYEIIIPYSSAALPYKHLFLFLFCKSSGMNLELFRKKNQNIIRGYKKKVFRIRFSNNGMETIFILRVYFMIASYCFVFVVEVSTLLVKRKVYISV